MRQITASRAEKSEGMPIGELSRLTGVNIETIRYYEKIKMLPIPLRTEGRSLSDTFAGIAPAGVAAFIIAQMTGTLAAFILGRWLWREP